MYDTRETTVAIARVAKRIRIKWHNGAWMALKPKADVRDGWSDATVLAAVESARLKDVTFHCIEIPGCGQGRVGYAEGTISVEPVNLDASSNLGFSALRGGYFYDRHDNKREPLLNAKVLDLLPGGRAHAEVLTEDRG